MKKTCLLVFTIAVLISLAVFLPVHADEAAKYNFATAQGDKELTIPPGEEVRGYIYFYNIDGNRVTHVSLEVSGAPSGWEVTIEPPLSETQVLVSGMPVMVEENLYVEPSELLSEEPQDVPEGMVSIKVPGRGYTLGKLAEIAITVPESESLGTTGEISIAAEAAWLGQGGSAAIKQARDFDFSITVVSASAEYTETIVGQGEASPETGENTETEDPAGVIPPVTPEGETSGFSLTQWLPAIIAGVIVILGAVFIPLLVRRGR